MKTKQPLFTALGWLTWTIGKRVIKRKITGGQGSHRGRKLLLAAVVVGGAGAGAYAVTNGSQTQA